MEPKNELQRNAIAEARKMELDTYQRALDIQWLNSRMEDGRMGRCLALIQREAEMEKDFQERTDHAAIVNARAEKEIALGVEVAKVRREEACALLRRHHLRERDPGLRDLSRKLQAGYVCRDLKQQILNNEYKRLQDKAEDNHANSILLNALYNEQQAKQREDEQKAETSSLYRRDLQLQLVNRQMEKQGLYEDTLVEKKMLEEIMRTIADEDQRELHQKRVLMARTCKEMETCQLAREAWQQKQKEMLVIEEREIEKQRNAAANRSSDIVAKREKKIREKEELIQRVGTKKMADEVERQERVDIIKLLQEQEALEKNSNNDKAEKEKLERAKKETKAALTAQMNSKKKVAVEEKLMEAEFRKKAEAKMAEDNARELSKEMQKMEKGRAYSSQLQRQMADNAARRGRDRARDRARDQALWDYHKAWDAEVSEERRKIISSHVPSLRGHLQRGTELLPTRARASPRTTPQPTGRLHP